MLTSVVELLYKISIEKKIILALIVGFVSINPSSEACENSKNGRVVETLWYHNMLRGVSIRPLQYLTVNKWISFDNLPVHLNPLFSSLKCNLDAEGDNEPTVFVLLETNIYPDLDAIQSGANIVNVCHDNSNGNFFNVKFIHFISKFIL